MILDTKSMVASSDFLIARVWAMPNAETFSIRPISELVDRYLSSSSVSVDPFARNAELATHTNDLNPNTTAQHHMDAFDFLVMLKDNYVKADLVMFDPPYSPRQIVECYSGIGLDTGNLSKIKDRIPTQRMAWKQEKQVIASIQKYGDRVICFGWNSNGMGKKRGYKLIELLLVAHGSGHNDTIVTVWQKAFRQQELL